MLLICCAVGSLACCHFLWSVVFQEAHKLSVAIRCHVELVALNKSLLDFVSRSNHSKFSRLESLMVILNCSRAPSCFSECSMLRDSVYFTTLKSLDYNVVMTFRFNNNNKQAIAINSNSWARDAEFLFFCGTPTLTPGLENLGLQTPTLAVKTSTPTQGP